MPGVCGSFQNKFDTRSRNGGSCPLQVAPSPSPYKTFDKTCMRRGHAAVAASSGCARLRPTLKHE